MWEQGDDLNEICYIQLDCVWWALMKLHHTNKQTYGGVDDDDDDDDHYSQSQTVTKMITTSSCFQWSNNELSDVATWQVRDLQLAMAELHDQFRDEETVELRELQRELEATAKACRIAQFKLRKADRRCDQLDAERAQAEERVRCLENCLQGSVCRQTFIVCFCSAFWRNKNWLIR